MSKITNKTKQGISKDRRILIRKRLDEIMEKLLSDREATITAWHLAYVLESISCIWDELARDHEADIKMAQIEMLGKTMPKILDYLSAHIDKDSNELLLDRRKFVEFADFLSELIGSQV